jgi:inhibitor of KinA
MQDDFTIFPLGDGALMISFGNVINKEINQKVLQLFHRLNNVFPFIKDMVPAYSSLAVYYDVVSLYTKEKPAYDRMKELLLPFLQEATSIDVSFGREISIPVCYAKSFALDLQEMATQKGLSTDEIIRLHTAGLYRVYMIGFLPGFPYMGKVDERIATPRRSSPRTSIPAGSVGIAGEQTGIYSLASPGGWNIIGRTPLQLFSQNKTEPVLLQPGDSVTFYPITEDEFGNHQSRPA